MPGDCSETGVGGRGEEITWGLAETGVAVEAGIDDLLDAVEADEDATATGADATATGAINNFVPHIPQKRFPSELSLPQRGQRTHPP
jgi:hypothetical protein